MCVTEKWEAVTKIVTYTRDTEITPRNCDACTKASCGAGAWCGLVYGQGEESPTNNKENESRVSGHSTEQSHTLAKQMLCAGKRPAPSLSAGTPGTGISPVDFAVEVAGPPLSSLRLRFRGRGLYSRLGRVDATDILQHTAEGGGHEPPEPGRASSPEGPGTQGATSTH